jgi:hypothetical protein
MLGHKLLMSKAAVVSVHWPVRRSTRFHRYAASRSTFFRRARTPPSKRQRPAILANAPTTSFPSSLAALVSTSRPPDIYVQELCHQKSEKSGRVWLPKLPNRSPLNDATNADTGCLQPHSHRVAGDELFLSFDRNDGVAYCPNVEADEQREPCQYGNHSVCERTIATKSTFAIRTTNQPCNVGRKGIHVERCMSARREFGNPRNRRVRGIGSSQGRRHRSMDVTSKS